MARARRVAVTLLAVLYAAPLGLLVIRTAADVWRYPAAWPQELGLRGVAFAFSPATGAVPALRNSLVVGLAVTVVALALGWPAARVLARGGRRVRATLVVMLGLPLLVPPLAVGHGLSTWLLRLGLVDSLAALVVSHLVYVLPYVTLLLAAGFTSDIVALEEAATTLGAGPGSRLRLVTFPAVAPAAALAVLLGFVVSWSQYGTSLTVAAGVPTLPLLLVPFVQHDPQLASALTLVFLVPPALGLAVATRLGRHR